MKNNYRLILFGTWCICYFVILVSYLSIIHKDNPITDSPEQIWALFGTVSALIIPQITIMFAFYFERSNEEINKIITNRPHGNLAYWFSFFYIITFCIVVILGIPFEFWLDGDINQTTKFIVIIMGHLSLFVIVPMKYLFK